MQAFNLHRCCSGRLETVAHTLRLLQVQDSRHASSPGLQVASSHELARDAVAVVRRGHKSPHVLVVGHQHSGDAVLVGVAQRHLRISRNVVRGILARRNT